MRSGLLILVLLPALGAQVITTVAGNDHSLTLANLQNKCDPNRFEQTSHIAIDARGAIYLADSNNQRIRRIDPDGTMTTIAGDGAAPSPTCLSFNPVNDGPSAVAAHLYQPADMLAMPNGNLVIADQQNNRIRQIAPNGAITTIAGNGLHNLYAPGVTATASPMDWPSALALDPSGQIVFAEVHSNRIGRIGADGKLATVAGNGFPGTATLTKPMGIAIDRAGNVFIADTGNHRIRKAAPDGTLTTIAGTGVESFCGDNGPALSACFDTPMDVKLDSRGNFYVADTANHRIRRIDPAGIVTTVAGTGVAGRGADNVSPAASALNYPCAIALDANDDLYIVDWQNFLVRKVAFNAPSIAAVVDGASFSAPPAPGGIFTIFGANLPASPAVQVNGKTAPVFYAGPTQINAQLPYEIALGPATVTVNGLPFAVTVVAAAPAIFVALRQDSVAIAYVTGLGKVSPPVGTGVAAPLDTLSYAEATVTATIGGMPAQVLFAGLAPGFAGLGQVNAVIPDGAADLTLVLEINGQKSKPAPIRP
jgi:uncharacterized protein (TIGR03437 family)